MSSFRTTTSAGDVHWECASSPVKATNASSSDDVPAREMRSSGEFWQPRALGDYDDAITEGRHLLHNMTGKQHTPPLGPQVPDQVAHGSAYS
jgi:hypothetical protein